MRESCSSPEDAADELSRKHDEVQFELVLDMDFRETSGQEEKLKQAVAADVALAANTSVDQVMNDTNARGSKCACQREICFLIRQ